MDLIRKKCHVLEMGKDRKKGPHGALNYESKEIITASEERDLGVVI